MTRILHHGGKLMVEEDNGGVRYYGGQMCVWEDIGGDTINIFMLEDLAETHCYPRFEKIWWRNT